MKREERVRRQGFVLGKVRDGSLKLGKARVSVFKEGHYSGWVGRKEFDGLRRAGAFELQRVQATRAKMFMPRFRSTILEKKVTVRVGKEGVKKVLRVETFTQSQRQYVYELFKKGLVPLNVDGRDERRVNVDLRDKFGEVGIRVERLKKESP